MSERLIIFNELNEVRGMTQELAELIFSSDDFLKKFRTLGKDSQARIVLEFYDKAVVKLVPNINERLGNILSASLNPQLKKNPRGRLNILKLSI